MKSFYTFTPTMTLICLLFMGATPLAFAQGTVNIEGGPLGEWDLLKSPPEGESLSEDHSGVSTWITKWYGPDGNYENNGGFGTSAPKDLIADGTNRLLTQTKLSTLEGVSLTQEVDIEWPVHNGDTRNWTVFELDPTNQENMNRNGPADNIDFYGIIVINAPIDMTSVMSPAHDDYAQIWINGEKWYNNARWTGAPQEVDFNIEVKLKKGANVLLYRCGESSGAAYVNLHFDKRTHDSVRIYPNKAHNQETFFEEIGSAFDVEPEHKLATTWANLKQRR